MNCSNKVTKRMFALPLICRICGAAARGMNFDVMTCMSCKAFFRRHALRPAGHLRCKHRYNCKITTASRTECAACRLKKCFTLGMKSQLIRVVSQYQSIWNNKQQLCMTERSQFQRPTLRPLGLLQNDRSTLTSEQWNLLSNIINVYDGQNIVKDIQCLLAEESSLPVRLRAKPSTALN